MLRPSPIALPLCILSTACAGLARAEPQPVALTVDTDKVVKDVDVGLYGHFLEHIYHSCSTGIWGEVVWNRSFEEGLPRAERGRPPSSNPAGGNGPRPTQPTTGGGAGGPPPESAAADVVPPAGGTKARHWFIAGNATVTVETERPLNSAKSLRIVTTAAGGGVTQANFALKVGDALTGSLWLRGEVPAGVTVRFVDGGKVLAEQALPAPGADWKEFPLSFDPTAASSGATLEIVTRGAGTLWLDQVSLMPATSRATGGFRPDLLKAIADIKPATMRWPGGSFVGTGDGYNWKTTIGPQHTRVGKIGWDEWETAAFGIDEFIALCRKVGAEPVVVVYMGPQAVTADRSKWIQDAADWVEYCNGPATSKWGAVRAANGHPEPYRVKYWEIDNEVWNTPADHYVEILRSFVPAMKRVDPGIVTIACGSGGFGKRFAEGDLAVIDKADDVVDFLSLHHYENANGYATGLAAMESYLDKMGALIAKSKNPNFKIYFSEWNAQCTDWRTGLYAGGVLNLFERHPYVAMTCPALWLRHTSAPAWDNAFINFDHNTWFPAPNYIVMRLYRDHFAPHVLAFSGDAGGLNVVATKSADGHKVVLKIVNPKDAAIDAHITLAGGFRPANARLQLVAPDALDARNTIAQPDVVHVVDGTIARTGNTVTLSMPRWSVGVVELGD